MNLFTINVTSANIIDVHIVLMNDCELFGVDVFIAKKYDGFNFISFLFVLPVLTVRNLQKTT